MIIFDRTNVIIFDISISAVVSTNVIIFAVFIEGDHVSSKMIIIFKAIGRVSIFEK